MNPTIANTRLVAIFLMTMSHLPGSIVVLNGFAEAFGSLGPGKLVALLTGDGVARISAPMLGLFSGWLAIRSMSRVGGAALLKARVVSLLLPAWFWSFVMIALWFMMGLMKGDLSGFSDTMARYGFDAIFGVFKFPANYAMHYVIDLFQCSLLLVALEGVQRLFAGIRDRQVAMFYLVLAIVGSLALTFGTLDPASKAQPGLNQDSILVRSDLFLFFFAGVALAKIGSNVPALIERFAARISLPLLALLIVVFVTSALTWRALVVTTDPLLVACGAMMLFVVRITGSALMACAVVALQPAFARLNLPDRFAFRLFCIHAVVFSAMEPIFRWTKADLSNSLIYMEALFLFPLVGAIVAWASLALQDRTALRDLRI